MGSGQNDTSTEHSKKPVRSIELRRWMPVYIILLSLTVFSSWAVFYYSSLQTHRINDLTAQWQRDLLLADTFIGQSESRPDAAYISSILENLADDPYLDVLAVVTSDNRVFANVIKKNFGGKEKGRLALEAFPLFNEKTAQRIREDRSGRSEFVQFDDGLVAYHPLRLRLSEGATAPTGYLVFLSTDLSKLRYDMLQVFLRDITIPLLLLLIGTLIGIALLRRFISLPLKVLVQATEDFARGLRTESHLKGSGELYALSEVFNKSSAEMLELVDDLQEREQYLDRTFEAIVEGVIVIDAEAVVTRLNPAAMIITGYQQSDIEGLPLKDFFLPISANGGASIQNAAIQALDTGRRVEPVSEQVIAKKDGSECHITQTAAPIFDPNGYSEGAILVFRDVTEEYHARAENRIGAIAFESDQPVIVTDAQGHVLRVNAATRKASLYEDDLVGKYIGDLYWEIGDIDLTDFLLKPGDRDSWTGRTVRVDTKGHAHHMIETITAVYDESRVVTHFVVTQRDVSELVEADRARSDSESRYRLLIQAMSDGVGLIDNEGCWVECNDALARMFGRDVGDVIGEKITAWSGLYQLDGAKSADKMEQLLGSIHHETTLEWQVIRPSGQVANLEVAVVPVAFSSRREFLATFHDITERRGREERTRILVEELAKKEKMIRLATSAGKVATFEFDFATGEIEWLVGEEGVIELPQEILSKSLEALGEWMSPEDHSYLVGLAGQSRETGKPLELEQRYVTEDGEEMWFQASGEVEADAEGNPLVLRGALVNITAVKAAHLKAEELAYYDPLTGLANRRLLLDRLQQAGSHAERKNIMGALLFIDLDHFKVINDSLGHKAGDELLKQIAARLSGMLRDEDTVARLGGDEFVVILPELSVDSARAAQEANNVAEKIIDLLGEGYQLAGQTHRMRASIGIAMFPRDGVGDTVLDRADAAMYKAKSKGRNTVAFYEPFMQEQADSRLAIENELNKALDMQQLRLYLQAQVDGDRNVVGAEALLRWLHPERGLILPGEFISVAEESGQIIEIGEWVLREACRQLAEWNKKSIDLRLAINVSALQFKSESFVDTLSACLADYGVGPGCLMLELTEYLLISDMDKTADLLPKIKALGVDVAVDNFGAGYSSLHQLQRLPLNQIKIDGRFSRDISGDGEGQILVETMTNLASNFNLDIVAEGVETEAQFNFLKARACTYYQGYLFGRPIPMDEFSSGLTLDIAATH